MGPLTILKRLAGGLRKPRVSAPDELQQRVESRIHAIKTGRTIELPPAVIRKNNVIPFRDPRKRA